MPLATGGSPRVLGRYAIFDEIASGGMATVHLGQLLGSAGFVRTVAIKRLHAAFARDADFRTMLLDEARVAGRIRHPNVVPTLDVVAAGDELFLVMEYVPGATLSAVANAAARRKERVPLQIAVAVTADALRGLHAAHEVRDDAGRPLNVVHRDVSPQNLIVGADGATRVLDFGVAKAVGQLSTTREGHVKGKLAYMAPEVLLGREPTRALDIFAMAVVLWELLTARRLYGRSSEGEIIAAVLSGTFVPPSRIIAGLPASFDDVVKRGLARAPEQRFPTAETMALAVEACAPRASAVEVAAWLRAMFGDDLARQAAVAAKIDTSCELEITRVASSIAIETPRATRRRTWLWSALGAVAVIAIASIGQCAVNPTRATARELVPAAPAGDGTEVATAPPSATSTASDPVPPAARPRSSASPPSTGAPPGPKKATPRPAPRPSPGAAVPAAPAAAATCVPYVRDASGRVQFNRACLDVK